MKNKAAFGFVTVLALALANSAWSQSVMLLPAGATWKYLDNGSDQGTAWRGLGFNDSAWLSGPAQLGYGDGDEATTINGGPASDRFVTSWFRRTFVVPPAPSLASLSVHLVRDDGGVVYLNGVEVFRSNMPGGVLNYLTFASSTVGGGAEGQFFSNTVSSANLLIGTNVLAVEIHQVDPTSTDVSFNLALTGVTGAATRPVLALQPTNTGTFMGGSAGFAVGVTGNGPFGYQWHKDGLPLPGSARVVGVSAPALNLADVTAADVGGYSVVVSNSAGAVTSAVATLTLQLPPTTVIDDFEPDVDITQWSGFTGIVRAATHGGNISPPNALTFGGNNQRAAITRPIDTTAGGFISFWIRISDGAGEPWDHAELPGEGIVLEYSTNGGTNWSRLGTYDTEDLYVWTLQEMFIPRGAMAPRTMFRWRQLENSGSCCDHWALDDVLIESLPFPPLIVNEPVDRVVLEGGTATFSVEAAGTPNLMYQWSFNGTGLANATNSTFSVHGANSNHIGLYRVFIENGLGFVESREARLNVISGEQSTFRITALTTNQSRVVVHAALTGDDRGGLAVSTNRVLVFGDDATAAYDLADLENPAAVPVIYDAVITDLRSGAVYALGEDTQPLTDAGGIATRLLEVNGQTGLLTGNAIPLSEPIPFSAFFPAYGNIGFFAGYGRAAIHNGTNVYTIILPEGLVLDLGPLPALQHLYSDTWAFWGVMEFFDGATWLTRAANLQTIVRTRVGDGLSQTVATFRNIGTMSGFSVVPASNRWYFQTSFSSEFGLVAQVAGYAGATFSFLQTSQAVSIVQGPRGRTVALGSTAEFTVSALGFPLFYQWLREGVPLPGETGSRLRLINVTTNDAGLYSVVVSNHLGSVTSAAAQLRVVPQVIVSIFDDPNYVDTFGGPFSESDSVQASLTSLGHQVIPFATSNLAATLSTGRPVLIPALNFNDPIRTYTGVQRQAVQDFVVNGGLLIVHGANYSVNFLNGIFGLSLVNQFISGNAIPRTDQATNTAFADGPALLPGNSSTYGLASASLTLGSASAYETNGITTVATIPIGSGRIVFLGWDWSNARPLGTQDGGWLEILNAALLETAPPPPAPPSIAVQPRDRPAVVGVDIPLNVIAYGAGPISFQWYFNGAPLSGARSSGLTIALPTTNHSGMYWVVISNSFGAITSRVAQVTVRPSRGQIGYYTDYDFESTGPELSILQAAFTPVRLLDITPASLPSLRMLVINQAGFDSISPQLLTRLPDITTWVANGGRLVVHDISSSSSSLLLGATRTPLQIYATNTLQVVPPGNTLVTAGPHGTLSNSNLVSSNFLSYTATQGDLPPGAVPILRAGPAQTVAFSYGLGAGVVYYSTVLLAGYFDTPLPETELLRSVYLPNVIEYANVFVPSGPAVIVEAPSSTGALPNGRAVLTVYAAGQPPLRYQWFFNDAPISGATNASLIINGANASHVGDYRVMVSNAINSTNSPTAHLSLLDALTFKIGTLGTGGSQVVDHDALTSDDRGGIAISSNSVFVTGDSFSARYSAANLTGGTRLPALYDALIGNLRDETVYSLALGTNLLQFGGRADSLVQIDGNTGLLTTNRIPLSIPLTLGSGVGIFSGYDAAVVHDGTRAWRIDFRSGFVTDLGFMAAPTHTSCESWAYWGVAEFFNGAMWLMYVRDNRTINRIRVPDGFTETVATFNNLSDMCSFTFSPSRDRWYFHYEGSGQFGGQSETLGYASATWDHPPTLSGPGATTLAEDANPGPIFLNLTDDFTPATSLVVTATSSDTNVLAVTLGTVGTLRTLTATPVPNRYGTSIVSITVSDAIGNILRRDYPYVVTPVNDAPSFTPGTNVVVLEDAGTITLPGWASQITAGPNEPGQVLTFGITNDNPGLFNQLPVLGINGNLSFTAAPNAHGIANIIATLLDDGGVANGGRNSSVPWLFTIRVTPVNDPPVATAQSITTLEDVELPLTLAGTDIDGDPLNFVVVTPPAHGAVVGTGANVVYRPATNYSGPDSFTFRANDGQADSPPVAVTITITPQNDPPAIAPLTLVTDEDTAAPASLQATDPEGQPLTFRIVTQPVHGSLTGNAPALSYVPQTNFAGADQFTFQADDGQGGVSLATVLITVRPVNDPPLTRDASFTSDEDLPISIVLEASDVEGDALTYTITRQPQHGTLSGSGANWVYTPATNFAGADDFEFRARDGQADSNTGRVQLVIRPLNDAPVPVAASVTTPEDTALPITLAATDPDGDTLRFTVLTFPTHGMLRGTAPNVIYEPARDYFGPDSFTFEVADGQTNSGPTTVALNVQPVNDAPTAAALSLATDQGVPVSFNFPATDADADTLKFAIVTPPSHGTLTGKTIARTYTPRADFHGTDSFVYQVSDGQLTAEATVTITVRLVNEAPTAVVRVLNLIFVTPNATRGVILASDNLRGTAILDGSLSSDPDGTPLVYAWSSGGTVFATGAVVTNAFGLGSHVVTLRVDDGQASGTATVTFEVITAADALAQLIAYLNESGLPSNRLRPLLSSLEAAAASYARGNMNAGANQMSAFQSKVATQIQGSYPALAASLQASAQAIIEAMSH